MFWKQRMEVDTTDRRRHDADAKVAALCKIAFQKHVKMSILQPAHVNFNFFSLLYCDCVYKNSSENGKTMKTQNT